MLQVLAFIAVNNINDNATTVIDFIKEVRKGTWDLQLKTALQGCNEAYKLAKRASYWNQQLCLWTLWGGSVHC